MQSQFGTSVVSEVSEAAAAVQCEGGEKKAGVILYFSYCAMGKYHQIWISPFLSTFWLPYMVWCS